MYARQLDLPIQTHLAETRRGATPHSRRQAPPRSCGSIALASGRTYPVLYLLHGGAEDFRTFDLVHNIRALTAGRPIIVVMPDGGRAGWYCNPVSSFVGPRNWEDFHMAELLPWIDANFRTYAEFDGRAVAGFSMGGFGALKYTAKYFGHFASVSSHSGPASLRRDGGLVVHWANVTSAFLELGGGMVYGEPPAEARVHADNPVENIDRYRGKRIFLVAGANDDPIDWINVFSCRQRGAGACRTARVPPTPHGRRYPARVA